MQFQPNFVSIEKKIEDGQIDVEFKLEIKENSEKGFFKSKWKKSYMKKIDLEWPDMILQILGFWLNLFVVMFWAK